MEVSFSLIMFRYSWLFSLNFLLVIVSLSENGSDAEWAGARHKATVQTMPCATMAPSFGKLPKRCGPP